MRIAMIDPSLFTLPYDCALCGALENAGCDVTLYGRPRRNSDGAVACPNLAPHFYTVSERSFLRNLPKPLAAAVRGLDHAVSLLGLWRRLKSARPDVIHFQWLPLPLLDATMLGTFRRIAPLVLTVHDTDPFNGNPGARVQSLGMDRALQKFNRLIVHTQQGVARLKDKGVPANRISVMPLGRENGAPYETPDTMHGKLTFLLFGKIKPYKGADLLIDAYAALPSSLRSQARVRIVGKPYMDLAPLAAQAAARGVAEDVSIEPAFVPDNAVNDLFCSATVAVFPYREIEASGVLYQAVANGRPIVATALGAFTDLLQDGVHGNLVPPDDVPALTAALAGLIADRNKAAACAAAVRRLQNTLPEWNQVGRATRAVYLAAKVATRRFAPEAAATVSAKA